MTYRKKLIEVALPLDVIKREPVRQGHPSTIHLWWARRPLAACRAMVFASVIDDPGNDLKENAASKERERLFSIIEQLVNMDVDDEGIYEIVSKEIRKHVRGDLPPILDPMAGYGPIPLVAQNLGFEVHANDCTAPLEIKPLLRE
jgi:putative DNA methylase